MRYNECFCHSFGFDGGYAVCCEECKYVSPDCITRHIYNNIYKHLRTKKQ